MGKNVLSREEWKRRQKVKRYALLGGILIVAILFIVVIITMISSIIKLFKSDDTSKDTLARIKKSISVTESLLTEKSKVRPGVELKEVKNIVIHYSGSAGTSAQARRDYYESLIKDEAASPQSMHYIVGLDGKIVQCIPDTEAALASGVRNTDSISVEYCHIDSDGTCEGDTYTALVNITAYLLAKYNLTTENVIMHSDINGAVCPLYFAKNPDIWQKFLSDVRQTLSADTQEKQ